MIVSEVFFTLSQPAISEGNKQVWLVRMAGAEFEHQQTFLAAVSLVRQAGLTIKEAFTAPKVVSVKSEPTDLVTATDKQVEEALRQGLADLLPQAAFVGEESTNEGVELTSQPTWVVDPLDGTSNFVHGNPHLCVILGLLVNKEVQFCIVFNPILGQEWTARRGCGADYNGTRIQVSGCTKLDRALLVQQTTPVVGEAVEAVRLANLATFLPLVQGLRVTGSSGIDLAYLAMGAVDVFFHFGHHIWDYAAASLLVEEAGGVVGDPGGGPLDFLARRCLAAASPQLFAQTVPRISLLDLGRD